MLHLLARFDRTPLACRSHAAAHSPPARVARAPSTCPRPICPCCSPDSAHVSPSCPMLAAFRQVPAERRPVFADPWQSGATSVKLGGVLPTCHCWPHPGKVRPSKPARIRKVATVGGSVHHRAKLGRQGRGTFGAQPSQQQAKFGRSGWSGPNGEGTSGIKRGLHVRAACKSTTTSAIAASPASAPVATSRKMSRARLASARRLNQRSVWVGPGPTLGRVRPSRAKLKPTSGKCEHAGRGQVHGTHAACGRHASGDGS